MAEPASEPTDEVLRAFALSLLSDLPETLVEPGAIDEAVRDQRDLWAMLYSVGWGGEMPADSPG